MGPNGPLLFSQGLWPNMPHCVRNASPHTLTLAHKLLNCRAQELEAHPNWGLPQKNVPVLG